MAYTVILLLESIQGMARDYIFLTCKNKGKISNLMSQTTCNEIRCSIRLIVITLGKNRKKITSKLLCTSLKYVIALILQLAKLSLSWVH